MASSVTSAHAGGILQEFVQILRQGLETVSGGHINVVNSDKKALYIPKIVTSGNVLQPHVVTPSDSGTTAYTESSVTLAKVDLLLKFVPEQFEDAWAPYQPVGLFNFVELPSEVQLFMIEDLIADAQAELELALWQGDTTGSAPLNIFDGILKKAAADAGVIDVSTPVTLNAGNIIAEITRLYAAIPAAVKFGPRRPKIFVSYGTWQLYGDAIKALTYKGNYVAEEAVRMFNGLEIVPLPGMPANKMIAAIANDTPQSDLHFAVPDAEANLTSVRVERVTPISEEFFMKMMFKAGVVFRHSGQITAYNA